MAYRNPEFGNDLRHECTHALLHAVLPAVPLWLDEGLAKYFEVQRASRAYGHPYLSSFAVDGAFAGIVLGGGFGEEKQRKRDGNPGISSGLGVGSFPAPWLRGRAGRTDTVCGGPAFWGPRRGFQLTFAKAHARSRQVHRHPFSGHGNLAPTPVSAAQARIRGHRTCCFGNDVTECLVVPAVAWRSWRDSHDEASLPQTSAWWPIRGQRFRTSTPLGHRHGTRPGDRTEAPGGLTETLAKC